MEIRRYPARTLDVLALAAAGFVCCFSCGTTARFRREEGGVTLRSAVVVDASACWTAVGVGNSAACASSSAGEESKYQDYCRGRLNDFPGGLLRYRNSLAVGAPKEEDGSTNESFEELHQRFHVHHPILTA